MTAEHNKHLAEKEKEFEQVLAQHRAERETALVEAAATTAKVAAELGALEKVLSQTKAEYEAFKVDHDKAVESLRAEHSASLATLSSVKQERDREHSRLAEALAKSEAALENLRITTQAELASSLQFAKQEHSTTLESLSKEHSGALSRLQAELDKKYAEAAAAWEVEKPLCRRPQLSKLPTSRRSTKLP
jgi:ABC-type transporter Mla subunit MlaD